MSAVVTFGELMMRLSPPGSELLLESPHFRAWFGGSEANVAVSLAHFGTPSALVTTLPQNPLGDAALSSLRSDSVDTTYVKRGGSRIGLYFVESGADQRPMRVVYDRAGSSFSETRRDTFDWARIFQGAEWFHVSGITPALSEGAADATAVALDAARTRGLRTSFDLNYRPALWQDRDPRPVVMPLAMGCHTIIANRSAIGAMLAIREADTADVASLSRAVCVELGCESVAITKRDVHSASRHTWSATLYEHETGALVSSRKYDMQVVDRVGGGDSFVAALIHAVRCGRAPQDALDFAVAASALKLTIAGDANRVTVGDVEQFLQSGD